MGMARSTVIAAALVAVVATWTSLGHEANAQGRGGRGGRGGGAPQTSTTPPAGVTPLPSISSPRKNFYLDARYWPTSVTRAATRRGS